MIAAQAKAHGRVIALADVDREVRALTAIDSKVAAQVRLTPAEICADVAAADRHVDYRRLLDDKRIDVVLIGTPDHWHSKMLIDAVKAGKDVSCEKPCGLTIDICGQIDDTMRRTGRTFQAGTQRRSVPNFQKAVQLVHDGRLGKLTELHASVYMPELRNDWLPGQPAPDPEEIDWNLWLGPCPWRPYNSAYVAERKWRGFFDFESGAKLLDRGAHTVDLCQWAGKYDATGPVEFMPSENNIVCRYADGVKLVLDFLPTPFGDRGPHSARATNASAAPMPRSTPAISSIA